MCGVISKFGQLHNGCPSGSGSGSVTSSAARIRPEFSASTSASVSTIGPRAAFTSSAPCRIKRKLAPPISPLRLRGRRQNQHHHLGLRQQLSSSLTACTSGAVRALRATRSIFTSNGAKHALDLFADCPVTHQQHRLSRQLLLHHRRMERARVAGDLRVVRAGLEAPLPYSRPLNIEIQRKILQHRQNRRQRPLRRGNIVRAVRIADRHVRAHRPRNPLRPRHHRQHQLHAVQVRPGAHGPRGIRIRNPHVDVDVVVHFVRHGNQLDSLGEIAKQVRRYAWLGIRLAAWGSLSPTGRGLLIRMLLARVSAVSVPHPFPARLRKRRGRDMPQIPIPRRCEKIQPRIAPMRLKTKKTWSQHQLAVKLRLEGAASRGFLPSSGVVCSSMPPRPRSPRLSAGGWRCVSACTTAIGDPSAPSSSCNRMSAPPSPPRATASSAPSSAPLFGFAFSLFSAPPWNYILAVFLAIVVCGLLGLRNSSRLACVTITIIMLVPSSASRWDLALDRVLRSVAWHRRRARRHHARSSRSRARLAARWPGSGISLARRILRGHSRRAFAARLRKICPRCAKMSQALLRGNNQLLEAARNEPSGPGWREGLSLLSQFGRSLYDALWPSSSLSKTAMKTVSRSNWSPCSRTSPTTFAPASTTWPAAFTSGASASPPRASISNRTSPISKRAWTSPPHRHRLFAGRDHARLRGAAASQADRAPAARHPH